MPNNQVSILDRIKDNGTETSSGKSIHTRLRNNMLRKSSQRRKQKGSMLDEWKDVHSTHEKKKKMGLNNW